MPWPRVPILLSSLRSAPQTLKKVPSSWVAEMESAHPSAVTSTVTEAVICTPSSVME